MARRRAEELEHRRGLVLGLTLAEALILLLFLLLLAMSSKLAAVQRAQESAGPAEQVVWPDSGSLVVAEPFSATVEIAGSAVGAPIETGSIDTEDHKRERALNVALQDVGKIAVEFDPNDPAAPLKRVEELLRVLPRNASSLADLNKVVQALEARKPGSASDEMKRAVAILERLPPGARPEDVMMKPTKTAGKDAERPDWPPIITLTEADLLFGSGGAELDSEQKDRLSGPVVDRLVEIIDKYRDVNVIEVIGHTDEQPIGSRPSNLDGSLFARVQGAPDRPEMISADNAGLGLARAVAVAEVLLQQKRLTRFRILPLSGAQLIDLNDDLSSGKGPRDMQSRRRIEIRVRRSERGDQAGVFERKPLAPVQEKTKTQETQGAEGDWNPFLWKF